MAVVAAHAERATGQFLDQGGQLLAREPADRRLGGGLARLEDLQGARAVGTERGEQAEGVRRGESQLGREPFAQGPLGQQRLEEGA